MYSRKEVLPSQWAGQYHFSQYRISQCYVAEVQNVAGVAACILSIPQLYTLSAVCKHTALLKELSTEDDDKDGVMSHTTGKQLLPL